MPIYEFRCTKCGHKFSKLSPLGETGVNLKCPSCQTPNPRRVMSGFTSNNSDNLYGSRGDSCTSCTAKNCNACKH